MPRDANPNPSTPPRQSPENSVDPVRPNAPLAQKAPTDQSERREKANTQTAQAPRYTTLLDPPEREANPSPPENYRPLYVRVPKKISDPPLDHRLQSLVFPRRYPTKMTSRRVHTPHRKTPPATPARPRSSDPFATSPPPNLAVPTAYRYRHSKRECPQQRDYPRCPVQKNSVPPTFHQNHLRGSTRPTNPSRPPHSRPPDRAHPSAI